MEIVIIGNSAAGVGAIEAIRKIDRASRITVISDEPHPIYSRPLISYLLSGEIKADQIYYRPKNFYEKNGVISLLGRRVKKVLFDQKNVQLEDGENIPYDRLLIATGGIPFIPKIEGIHKEGVFTFTKLDDVKKISSYLKHTKRALVIGGGLIGIKAAEALKKRGIDITIVELAEHILSLTMDETASSILERALKREGVNIITSNTVKEILGDGHVESISLADGKMMDVDLVIVAIGVVPNIEPFRGSPLNIEKGIIVNERMETNIKDVYASGDVTVTYDKVLGNYRTIPIWPNAYSQGKVAGNQIAGNENYLYGGGFMMNSIEVANIPTISIGLITPPSQDGYEVIKRFDRRSNSYKKIILRDNFIKGALFLGNIDRSGIITGLIRDGIKVKGFKNELRNDSFGFISLPKDLRKERIFNLR